MDFEVKRAKLASLCSEESVKILMDTFPFEHFTIRKFVSHAKDLHSKGETLVNSMSEFYSKTLKDCSTLVEPYLATHSERDPQAFLDKFVSDALKQLAPFHTKLSNRIADVQEFITTYNLDEKAVFCFGDPSVAHVCIA